MEIVFVVLALLKLFGVIDWSWLWVSAPIWGTFLAMVTMGATVTAVAKVREICS